MQVRLAAVGILLAATTGVAADETREIQRTIEADQARRIAVDLEVGRLVVVGMPGDTVEAELVIECRRKVEAKKCAKKKRRFEWVSSWDGDRLGVRAEGPSKWRSSGLDIVATVRVPDDRPLDVHLGIGQLELSAMRSDVRVDAGVGDVSVQLGADSVRSVTLDAGIGDAKLRGPAYGTDRRPWLVGSEVEWSGGDGPSRLDVDLQIGDISVEIEP